MNSTGKAIVLGAVLIVGAFFLWEGYFSAEARMERFLHSIAGPAEALKLEEVLSSIGDDYTDSFQQDKTLLASRLGEGFSKIDSLNITISSIQASYDGDRASGEFDLVVVARRGEERLMVVGTPLQPQHLSLEIARDDGDWQVRSVERKAPQEMPAP